MQCLLQKMSMDDGEMANISELKDLDVHTCTHLDGPGHFVNVRSVAEMHLVAAGYNLMFQTKFDHCTLFIDVMLLFLVGD